LKAHYNALNLFFTCILSFISAIVLSTLASASSDGSTDIFTTVSFLCCRNCEATLFALPKSNILSFISVAPLCPSDAPLKPAPPPCSALLIASTKEGGLVVVSLGGSSFLPVPELPLFPSIAS